MKILITGANGFLGSHMQSTWKKLGHEILSVGRSSANEIQCDLSLGAPELTAVDYVIHSAGKAHVVPKNEREAKEFYDINVTGTQNLLMALEKLKTKPKSILLVSSASVYGRQTGTGISEDSELAAQDPYGMSKILSEELITNWGITNNVTTAIIRPPLIIGKNAPGNLKQMIEAIKSGKYRNIDGGTAKRSMVLAEDIAEFTPTLLEHGGIYNVTDGVDPSFKDLSNLIGKKLDKKILNLPLSIAKLIAFAGNVLGKLLKKEMPFSSQKLHKMTNSLTLDSSKVRQLGWQPKSVLEHPNLWL